jgi:hypothetical protein
MEKTITDAEQMEKKDFNTSALQPTIQPLVDTVSCQTVAKDITSGVTRLFVCIFCWLECVGHSFTDVAHL